MESAEAVGLAVDHLLNEKFSDNSEAELGFITRKETRKRKRGSQTDASCSSSGAGSPLNLPYGLGYIGIPIERESADECNSDGSRPRSLSRLPGYHSATTAIVTDSEDEIDFPNDVTDLDTFSVEYEPPDTNSEDENDDDDSDDEQVIIIPSSSEDEDPGAEGGDEYDVDSDSDDSWECAECWTINHPMTTKCLMCWKERKSWVPLKLNSLSGNPVVEPSKLLRPAVNDLKPATSILLEKTAVSLSRSSSSCSSNQASSDSGICVSSCETDTHETMLHDGLVLSCAFSASHSHSLHEAKPLLHEAIPLLHDSKPDSNVSGIFLQLETSKDTPTLETTEEHQQVKEVLLTSDNALKNCTKKNLEDKDVITTNDKQKDNTLNLCVICSTEPRNASIIHGRSGHQVCCITCAEKLKADRKRCPVCRRRIHLVIKNFL